MAEALVDEDRASEVLLDHVGVCEEAARGDNDRLRFDACGAVGALGNYAAYGAFVVLDKLGALVAEHGRERLALGAHGAEVVGARRSLLQVDMAAAVEHGVFLGGVGKRVQELHAAVDEVIRRLGARADDVAQNLAVALVVRSGLHPLEGLLLGEVMVVLELLFALNHPCARGVGVRGSLEIVRRVDCDDLCALIGSGQGRHQAGRAEANHGDVAAQRFGGFFCKRLAGSLNRCHRSCKRGYRRCPFDERAPAYPLECHPCSPSACVTSLSLRAGEMLGCAVAVGSRGDAGESEQGV